MSEPKAPPLERILARSEHGPRPVADVAAGRDSRKVAMPTRRPPTLKVTLTRRAHNRPTRVPRTDWERVVSGSKRMFRTYSSNWRDRFDPLFPEGEEFPRPALIYSQAQDTRLCDTELAVITAYRMEPLGAISPGDLALEGFQRVSSFRRYWKLRYHRWGWRPGDMISVVELRPWEEQDDEEQGAWLLRQLYGDWQ